MHIRYRHRLPLTPRLLIKTLYVAGRNLRQKSCFRQQVVVDDRVWLYHRRSSAVVNHFTTVAIHRQQLVADDRNEWRAAVHCIGYDKPILLNLFV